MLLPVQSRVTTRAYGCSVLAADAICGRRVLLACDVAGGRWGPGERLGQTAFRGGAPRVRAQSGAGTMGTAPSRGDLTGILEDTHQAEMSLIRGMTPSFS